MSVPLMPVLVDICGTLYNSNTTFDFLDQYLSKSSYKAFRKITKNLFWRAFNKAIIYSVGLDLTRILAVRFLKGHSRSRLQQAMDEFYTNYLSTRENRQVIQLVQRFKNEGHPVIIVSATLDFIASKIAGEMGIVTYYATALAYKREICLGVIKNDLLNRKLPFLMSLGITPPYAAVITDNVSDCQLLNASDLAFVISSKDMKALWEKRLINHKNVHYFFV